MQARLRRSHWDLEGLGDDRRGHPEVVVQDEHGSLVRTEATEAALELVAIGDVRGRVAGGRRHDRRELDLDGPALSPADGVEGGVDGQSMQPGIEPFGITEARKVPPRSDVCILDSVSRELVVPDDQSSDGLQPRDGRLDERGEGVMIAACCSSDEFDLVHNPLVARPVGRVQG